MQPPLMIRRLLALWVLLSLLGYSSVWAMDLHRGGSHKPHQTSVSTPHVELDQQQHHAPLADTAPCSDHCGHGAAHLIGLAGEPGPNLVATADSAQALPSRLFSSRSPAPDLRPPIA